MQTPHFAQLLQMQEEIQEQNETRMADNLIKPYVATPEEKRLRKAVCDTLPLYELAYNFHSNGGHFVERLLKHLKPRGYQYLSSSLYLTLAGCSCRGSSDSIPCKVREEIEKEIIRAYEQ